jgi:two-component system sensor histidine kinase QseC
VSTRRASLRRRLLLLLAGSMLLGQLLVGAGVFLAAQEEIGELFDAELAGSARTLLDLPIGAGAPDATAPPAAPLHDYERKLAHVLRDEQGRIIHRSAYADLAWVDQNCAGFGSAAREGQDWRLVCLARPGRHVVVGQRLDIRGELQRNILTSQFLPFLLALPLIVALAWLAIGRGLEPLDALSAEIARRAPRDLDPIAPAGDIPREVEPLVAELNRLLSRVGAAIEHERRFTADAAHELRTPLAALRTQAEVARAALPAGTAARALDNVIAGVERAAHLVGQMLELARVDHSERARRAPVALYPLAQAVIGEAAQAAIDRQIELSLDGERKASVAGDQNLLAILLRNLVDNAVRYTPPGGEVRVRVAAGLIEVQDNGPGIPAEEREQVLQRFVRGAGSAAGGSGLGLSIVARVAQLHEARLVLDEAPGGPGLAARVVFPPDRPTRQRTAPDRSAAPV